MNIKFSIFLLFISVNCFAHHPGNKIDAEKPYPLINLEIIKDKVCLLYTSPSPRDGLLSRMPSSA